MPKPLSGHGKFPIFVGEWAIETSGNNNLEDRKNNINNRIYAFSKYTLGSAYWTAKVARDGLVNGEWNKTDYWSYGGFMLDGMVDGTSGWQTCF